MSPAVKPQPVFEDDDDPALMFAPPATKATPEPSTPSLSDQRSPRMPLGMMQANPENPRGTRIELASLCDDLRDHGQLQNVNLMSLARFLEEKPYLQDDVDHSIPYVVVNGCLRLEAAPGAGLKELKYELRDDWTADDIDECVIGENEHRTSLNPMRLGLQLARMLKRPKHLVKGRPSEASLARALKKSKAWVNQRIALTSLHRDLQDAVERTYEDKLKADEAGEQLASERVTFELARECIRLHESLQVELAAGNLPVEVAKAWIVKLRLNHEEQLRRWAAGEPYDVSDYAVVAEDAPPATDEADEQPADDEVKAPRLKPAYVLRAVERTPQGLASELRKDFSRGELTELIDELTAAVAEMTETG